MMRVACIALLIVASWSMAQTTQPATPVADPKKLVAEIDRLRAEVARLRTENSQLRAEATALKDQVAKSQTAQPRPTDEISAAMAEHRVANGMTLAQVQQSLEASKVYLDAESGDTKRYHAFLKDRGQVCYILTVVNGKVDAWRRQVSASGSGPRTSGEAIKP